MTAHFPDRETVQTVLSLATRAPSVHNTQPWRWRVGSQSLHLYADRGLRLPSTDPDSRDLFLSCGGAADPTTPAQRCRRVFGWISFRLRCRRAVAQSDSSEGSFRSMSRCTTPHA